MIKEVLDGDALLLNYKRHLWERMEQNGVPSNLRHGLCEYFATRRPVGGFLTSVLENRLFEAVQRWDSGDGCGLWGLVDFIYNYTPSTAWGSPDKVKDWLSSNEPVPTPFE